MRTMTRTALIPPLLLAGLLAACAEEQVAEADPAHVERLVASLDAQAAAQERDVPDAEPKALPAEKLQKADRIVTAIDKGPTERIDPSMVASLVGS